MGPINERFTGQAWEKMTVLQLALRMLGTALSKLGKQTGEPSKVQEQAQQKLWKTKSMRAD